MAPTPSSTTPTPPVAKAITLVERHAHGLVVADAKDRSQAITLLKEVKERREAVIAFFKDMKQRAHAAWKAITEKEAGYLRTLDAVERELKGEVLRYDQAQEAIRLAEERKLQAEAEKQAEAERQKLLKQAAKARGEAKKDLLAQAEDVEAPTVTVAPTLVHEEGEATRYVWKARVLDEAKVPRAYLMVDQKKLDAYAKEQKEQASVPGVEFYSEPVLAISK